MELSKEAYRLCQESKGVSTKAHIVTLLTAISIQSLQFSITTGSGRVNVTWPYIFFITFTCATLYNFIPRLN